MFEATWESLKQYKCPRWFQDAKFGIWAHWGPQSVPMAGDWYARNMYVQGHPQYEHHRRTYGHPSRVGYKDVVGLWKGEHWDPDRLIDLYRRAGARYFVSMGVHHDNFDLWNSTHHEWNSTRVGPLRDIVGDWARAARTAGLRFGVSEHLERTYSWFNTNKGSDAAGPYAGIPYDGSDPEYVALYTDNQGPESPWYPVNPGASWPAHWRARITDLIDRHEPDFLYTDGGVPFGQAGLDVVAHHYNRSIERDGSLDAVQTFRDPRRHRGPIGEPADGIGTLDVERGVIEETSDHPWQTCTCLGGWFYDSRQPYKTPDLVIHLLADVVSKNGCLLLSVPQRPDGRLDEEAEWTVREIGRWMTVNGEAIYGTRPWRRFDEGPTAFAASTHGEREERAFTSADFRFTARDDAIYAIAMGRPEGGGWLIRALAGETVQLASILGMEHADWRVTPAGLWVEAPAALPCDHAWVIKVIGVRTK